MPELNFGPYIQSAVQPAQADIYLSGSFPYYANLNAGNREKFLTRLFYFTQHKKFVPRQEAEVTDEVRVLISACAIQLTFGLENYLIEYFDTILVYPDIYKSPHSDNMHHGEVNLAGFICFSWKSLKNGIGANDNFNVGLHEWSHALRFNGFRGNAGDNFFEGFFMKWLAAGNSLYNSIRGGKDKLFNKYAGTNLGEFFPVLMEHFFENPQHFKQTYPVEYNYTCMLLNQDPLNAMNPIGNVRQKLMASYIDGDFSGVLLRGEKKWLPASFVVPLVIGGFLIAVSLYGQGWWCASFFFLAIAVPFLVFNMRRRKVVLTTSGLMVMKRVADPLNRHTRKYPWIKIISVEFRSQTSGDAGDEHYTGDYDQLVFKVLEENHSTKEIDMDIYIPAPEAERLERQFRENRVAVSRRVIRGGTPV